MFLVIISKLSLEVCDDVCEYVNLKCEIMLLNHNKSQRSHKICDVSRNS